MENIWKNQCIWIILYLLHTLFIYVISQVYSKVGNYPLFQVLSVQYGPGHVTSLTFPGPVTPNIWPDPWPIHSEMEGLKEQI